MRSFLTNSMDAAPPSKNQCLSYRSTGIDAASVARSLVICWLSSHCRKNIWALSILTFTALLHQDRYCDTDPTFCSVCRQRPVHDWRTSRFKTSQIKWERKGYLIRLIFFGLSVLLFNSKPWVNRWKKSYSIKVSAPYSFSLGLRGLPDHCSRSSEKDLLQTRVRCPDFSKMGRKEESYFLKK